MPRNLLIFCWTAAMMVNPRLLVFLSKFLDTQRLTNMKLSKRFLPSRRSCPWKSSLRATVVFIQIARRHSWRDQATARWSLTVSQ